MLMINYRRLEASKNDSSLSSTLQKSKSVISSNGHYLMYVCRCLPETEFHLDIPKHNWPPV